MSNLPFLPCFLNFTLLFIRAKTRERQKAESTFAKFTKFRYNVGSAKCKGVKMSAKAVDYSTYSEQALFLELNSTREQLAKLESEKAILLDKEIQIEQALHSIPTEETADALRNSYTVFKTKDYAEFEKMIASEDDE